MVRLLQDYAVVIKANGVEAVITVEARSEESARNKFKKLFKTMRLPSENLEIERL